MRSLALTARRGFTLIELLVVLGVLGIVIALVLPALGAGRQRGYAAQNMSNIRAMALGVVMYADAHRGYPPAYGVPRWPDGAPWVFDFGEVPHGNWFDHKWLYSYMITGFLGTVDVASAPRRPGGPRALGEHQGQTVCLSDYVLTSSLYASPEFWNWKTQKGATQFGVQLLDSVVYPSNKGMMMQMWIWHMSEYSGFTWSCCEFDVPSPVVMFDLSVPELILRRLPRGMWNLFEVNTSDPPEPTRAPGMPVVNTIDGTRGRDVP